MEEKGWLCYMFCSYNGASSELCAEHTGTSKPPRPDIAIAEQHTHPKQFTTPNTTGAQTPLCSGEELSLYVREARTRNHPQMSGKQQKKYFRAFFFFFSLEIREKSPQPQPKLLLALFF